MTHRTYQEIRDEAAQTADPAKLWKLNVEIGAKYKRNAEKARFLDFTNGGSVAAQDWFMNSEPAARALCAVVAAMLGKSLEGMTTQQIVAIAR